MRTHYKSVSFITKNISSENKKIADSKETIEASEKKLNGIGKRLYTQFRNFVKTNKSLYDDDFIDILSRPEYEIKEVEILQFKKTVRITANISPFGTRFVMVPFLFISDVNSYALSRKRKINFGKDATIDQVEKHYDGEIEKLKEEVKRLEEEKKSMTFDDEDWK